jgi:SNF2 family DNA or RNA helicase
MFQPPKASFGIPPSKSSSMHLPPIATLTVEDDREGEEVNVPDFRDDNVFMSAGEAEKALRDLMGGGMNQEADAEAEIDMSQAIVEGFKPGIKLLPHQVLGRAWMRDREDVTKKRIGGILADDMGYFNLF